MCALHMSANISSNATFSHNEADETNNNDDVACGVVCPLCAIADVQTEHAGAVTSNNRHVRRIMALELTGFDKPDNVMYNNIAREYNRHIYGPMTESNLECTRWTGKMVKVHFEMHVQFVPRRIASKQLRRLERMAQIVDTEIDMRTTGDIPADTDGVD